jgi:hypothetical protein
MLVMVAVHFVVLVVVVGLVVVKEVALLEGRVVTFRVWGKMVGLEVVEEEGGNRVAQLAAA